LNKITLMFAIRFLQIIQSIKMTIRNSNFDFFIKKNGYNLNKKILLKSQ